MEAVSERFARCRECGHQEPARYFEDIEVMYPNRDGGLDPDWRTEKACPICGSSDVEIWEDLV